MFGQVLGNVGGRQDDPPVRWCVNVYGVVMLPEYKYSALGPDASEPITSVAMDGKAVWAAAGTHVIKYLRGKEVCMRLSFAFELRSFVVGRTHNESSEPYTLVYHRFW